MNKKIMLVFVAGSFAFISCAQKDSKGIPDNLKAIFTKKYPKAEEVKWEKEDDLFEVSFDDNELDVSILYDAQGNEKEVEKEIKEADLPQAVKDYMTKNLAGKKIQEVAQITDDKGVSKFEIEIKGKDYIFDSKGNLLEKK